MIPRVGRRLAFTPAELWSIWGMAAVVIGLHVVGIGLLMLTVSKDVQLGTSGAFGIGLAVTAFTLGMRHAFDADHIAAIDNTTRKLISRKDAVRPLSVGFYFSLGHSTSCSGCASCWRSVSERSPARLARIVLAAAGDRDDGTTVSGVFLC